MTRLNPLYVCPTSVDFTALLDVAVVLLFFCALLEGVTAIKNIAKNNKVRLIICTEIKWLLLILFCKCCFFV